MIINREELAWAAGFFDGEGSIAYTHGGERGTNGRMILSIWQKDRRPLARFSKSIGGIGFIRRVEPRKSPTSNKMCSAWALQMQSYEHVQATVAMMWRFLSEPKREQILMAFGKMHNYILNRRGKARGEKHPSNKLTIPQVRYIRTRRNIELAKDLATQFGVSKSAIWMIWMRRSWKWLEC